MSRKLLLDPYLAIHGKIMAKNGHFFMEFWPIFDIFHWLRPYLCSKREYLGFHKQATHRRHGDEPFFYSWGPPFMTFADGTLPVWLDHIVDIIAWLSSPCSTHEVQQEQGWQTSPKRRKTGEWSKTAWRWAVHRIEWWQNNDLKWVEWWGPNSTIIYEYFVFWWSRL